MHFFHEIPGGIAVVINPRREKVVFLHGFNEPRRNVGIIDTVPVAKAQQATVEPFVIGDFILRHALLQAVGGQPVHLPDIFPIVAPLHKKQACTRQIGRYRQVNAADTVRAPERFKVERAFVVYVVKGKPRRFDSFADVKFLAENAGQFAPVLLCPFNLLRQVVYLLDGSQRRVSLYPCRRVSPFAAVVQFVQNGQEMRVGNGSIRNLRGVIIHIVENTFPDGSGGRYHNKQGLPTRRHTLPHDFIKVSVLYAVQKSLIFTRQY